jgi:hypothetical protein
MREEALLFGNTTSLVGIITDPPEEIRANDLPAVVLLNAGVLHRVGPNRLYVKIARHLAAMGFVVLRFDFSGIGDSKAREDNLPFEKSSVIETQEAMNYLHMARGSERFVLIGLCLGATISFRTACCDPRVVGAVLINLGGNQSDELSSYIRNRNAARYYWKGALFNPKSWLRLIKRKTDYQNIIRVIGFQLRNLFSPTTKVFPQVNDSAGDFRLLIERGVHLLLINTEWDKGLEYLRMIFGGGIHELSAYGKLKIEIIRGANHIFSPLRSQEDLLKVVHNWAYAMVQG